MAYFPKMFGLIEQKPMPWGWSFWDAKDVYISIEVRCWKRSPKRLWLLVVPWLREFSHMEVFSKRMVAVNFWKALQDELIILGLGLRLIRTKRQKRLLFDFIVESRLWNGSWENKHGWVEVMRKWIWRSSNGMRWDVRIQDSTESRSQVHGIFSAWLN